MSNRSRYISKLLVTAATAAIFGSSVIADEVYVPTVLFSMDYGTGISQLPKGSNDEDEWLWQASISKLLVPSEDRIIIGKYGDARVIELNRFGELHSVIRSNKSAHQTKEQALTEFGDRQINDIAAAPHGSLLVSVSDHQQAIRVHSDVGAFDNQGWNNIHSQITANVKLPSSSMNWRSVRADAAGNYYISVYPFDKTKNSALAKFNAQLQFVGFMPGRGGFAGWNGYTYEPILNSASQQTNELRVYNSEGAAMRTLKLVPPKDISEGDYDSSMNLWAPTSKAVDSSGNIYLIVHRSRPKDQWIVLSSGFHIEHDVAIYKFGSDGHFVTKLVVDGLPCPVKMPVAVDPAGNIYHLAYYPDRVDLVKYTPSSTNQTTKIDFKNSFAKLGWKVFLKESTKTCAAVKGRTTLKVVVGKSYATINNVRIPVANPVTMTAGKLSAPQSLLQQVAKREQRVARFARLKTAKR